MRWKVSLVFSFVIQGDHKLHYRKCKKLITFLPQQWLSIQIFIHRCSMWLWRVIRHTSHSNPVSSDTVCSVSSPRLLIASRILSCIRVRDVVEKKKNPWCSFRNESRGVWGWVSTATQTPWCGNECRCRCDTQSIGRDYIQMERVSHHPGSYIERSSVLCNCCWAFQYVTWINSYKPSKLYFNDLKPGGKL
jgi:hypothetical protein